MQGSQPAGDLEQGSGVGPAVHPGGPAPYPWPSHNCLELGALPTAVACARLHARNLLWEWGLDWLAPDAELLVAELMASAVRATAARDEAAVRLRLSSDGTRVLIEVWDPDPWPPTAADRGQDGRPAPRGDRERGLFLVAALSARWDWYLTKGPNGKVVWCEIERLSPARHHGSSFRRRQNWLRAQAASPGPKRERPGHPEPGRSGSGSDPAGRHTSSQEFRLIHPQTTGLFCTYRAPSCQRFKSRTHRRPAGPVANAQMADARRRETDLLNNSWPLPGRRPTRQWLSGR
jgi:anti-sigma regulatory factor (Ser/Thr protein kinase)